MADFQSFLLHNMHQIGLEDEEEENDVKASSSSISNNTKTTKSSANSSTNSKFSTRESVHIKSPAKINKITKKINNDSNIVLKSPSNITTETFLSGTNLTESKQKPNQNDDNNNIRNTPSTGSNANLDDSNDYHLKSLGIVFSKKTQNKSRTSSSSSSSSTSSSNRDLSSPESILKSSTPIVISHNNYERIIKSPKPAKPPPPLNFDRELKNASSNESLDYRRVSSQRNKQKRQRPCLIDAASASESLDSINRSQAWVFFNRFKKRHSINQ